MTILIEECAILSGDAPGGVRTGQHIMIDGSTIRDITGTRPEGEFERVLDGRNRLAIPGLINAHTHSAENFVRATTERLTLEPWLVYLFGMCGPYSPRDHYLAIILGAIEMIHSGVTAVVDHFWMAPAPTAAAMDAAMQAYHDSGMRAAVAPLFRDAQYDVDYGIADGYPLEDTFFAQIPKHFPPLDDLLGLIEDFLTRWEPDINARVRAFVGPSGLQWCSQDLLTRSLEMARRHNTGFHMHLLETVVQDWACRRRFGMTGVEWLAQRELLGPEVSLPHSVHLTAHDVDLLGETGACVVHNIAANLKLGSGLAPIRRMLDAGVTVALGTDGAASNDNQVLFETLRLAAMAHTPTEPDPDRWISAREAWTMATEAGAVVMGLAGRSGQLRAGYLADIVLLDLSSPHLTPLNDPYRHLVFCESGASVRSVLVDGKVVMHEGRIEAFDEVSLIQEAREAATSHAVNRPVPPDIQDAVTRFAAFQKEIALHARS
jgi:5-methylthioadenosine/S-adenosylhomocysteine deaminase